MKEVSYHEQELISIRVELMHEVNIYRRISFIAIIIAYLLVVLLFVQYQTTRESKYLVKEYEQTLELQELELQEYSKEAFECKKILNTYKEIK